MAKHKQAIETATAAAPLAPAGAVAAAVAPMTVADAKADARETAASLLPVPCWEVRGEGLPRMDVQAPTAELAIWLYKQKLRVTRPVCAAKRVS